MSVTMLMDPTTTALVALLLFGTVAHAQPNKEQYELQAVRKAGGRGLCERLAQWGLKYCVRTDKGQLRKSLQLSFE